MTFRIILKHKTQKKVYVYNILNFFSSDFNRAKQFEFLQDAQETAIKALERIKKIGKIEGLVSSQTKKINDYHIEIQEINHIETIYLDE
jgi:hypothetical protein